MLGEGRTVEIEARLSSVLARHAGQSARPRPHTSPAAGHLSVGPQRLAHAGDSPASGKRLLRLDRFAKPLVDDRAAVDWRLHPADRAQGAAAMRQRTAPLVRPESRHECGELTSTMTLQWHDLT